MIQNKDNRGIERDVLQADNFDAPEIDAHRES
jgi:hypothetical protein